MTKLELDMIIGSIAIAVANIERATPNNPRLRTAAMYGVSSVVNELTDMFDNSLTQDEVIQTKYTADSFAIEALVLQRGLSPDYRREIATNLVDFARYLDSASGSTTLESQLQKTFTLFWGDGKREVIQGDDISDAMRRREYGSGTMRALDFYSEGTYDRYNWDGVKWVRKPE